MYLIGFTGFLLLIYCLLILFYLINWLSIPTKLNSILHEKYSTQISIIIPARNEEQNIKICIDSILKQDYPADLFEIIVVDDHSIDNTAAVVAAYNSESIKLISLADELNGNAINSYKKKAIEIAVQKAKGTLIVCTDADCIVTPKWLSSIAAAYEKHGSFFIASPVSFYQEDSLLKIFQSLDFLTMQGITGAAVYTKFQSMCNGANIAYEKRIFNEVGGFKGIDSIASGDDMLLMHKIAKLYPEKVMFLKNKNAIVRTLPVDSIKGFLNQRIRWASKADKYDDKKITGVLMVVYFFNVSLFITTIYTIFDNSFLIPCLLFWLFKTISELAFVIPVASFFGKVKLVWWFIPLQPFHVVYIIISGWLGKFGKYTWKERQVS